MHYKEARKKLKVTKCSVIFKAKIEQRLWEQLKEGKIAFLVAFCFFVHCFCYLLMECLYYFLSIQIIYPLQPRHQSKDSLTL